MGKAPPARPQPPFIHERKELEVNHRKHTTENGFTLIEILIVIAIIGTLATISIPSLLRSSNSAHEKATVGSLKVIATAQFNYHGDTNPSTFASTLQELSLATDSGGIPYIDPALAFGMRNGYTFTMQNDCESRAEGATVIWPCFEVAAVPIAYINTGNASYYIDETGIVRCEDVGGAFGGEAMLTLD